MSVILKLLLTALNLVATLAMVGPECARGLVVGGLFAFSLCVIWYPVGRPTPGEEERR